MLSKISKLMGIAMESDDSFDPAKFNDSLAVRIDWSPLKSGGANFRTRRLVQMDLDRMEFRPTMGAMLFGILFLILGIGAIGIGVFMIVSGAEVPIPAAFMLFLTGSVFSAAGAFMVRHFSSPVVFDGRSGYFWKGRQTPMEVMNRDELKCFSELDNIHALQLISEFCRSDKNSYLSYELNLVLKSGDRLNVFDHGHLHHARADADKLAQFLGLPLWDAVRR
ncbi:hypothetical protein P4C99_04495 [Pontiellaceae bacterium B1224]|nr:hypothetical protein [Pontiellaceae bacterium B1224]